jgi:hypothetical protein
MAVSAAEVIEHGVRRGLGRVGPLQSRAFVRFLVDWLTLPACGVEEGSDARLASGVAVMNDVAEGQVSRIDEHADFLACFADPP